MRYYICPMCCSPLVTDRENPKKGFCPECRDSVELTGVNVRDRTVFKNEDFTKWIKVSP